MAVLPRNYPGIFVNCFWLAAQLKTIARLGLNVPGPEGIIRNAGVSLLEAAWACRPCIMGGL
jgi:hypothetical protein